MFVGRAMDWYCRKEKKRGKCGLLWPFGETHVEKQGWKGIKCLWHEKLSKTSTEYVDEQLTLEVPTRPLPANIGD